MQFPKAINVMVRYIHLALGCKLWELIFYKNTQAWPRQQAKSYLWHYGGQMCLNSNERGKLILHVALL